jgi:hypothetical protein
LANPAPLKKRTEEKNMHKTLLLLLSAGLMLMALGNPAGAYPRTVLLEDFTNWA